MKSRSQKGALSRTYHSGQYRSQQESSRKWHYCTLLPPAERGKKIFSLPGNSSANGKSLYFKLPVSSNEIFVYRSSSQFPLLLYKSLLSFENWACMWFSIVPCPNLQLFQFSSVAQSCPTLCDPMDIRPPCPSPAPRVYSSSCPLSRWWDPAISSSVIPFSSCSQSFPASGSFQMSQLFTRGSQSIEVSASTSVLQWTPRTDLL